MIHKKNIFKVSSVALALSIGFTVLAPTTAIFAVEKNRNISGVCNFDSNEYRNASSKDLEIAKIISGNLEQTISENGNTQLVIKNRETLMSQLLASNSSLKFEDIELAVGNFNELLASNSLTRGTCSKALTFIGYVHAGSYAAAAALLGITGPLSVIVPLVIGLVYQAGVLLC